MINWALLMLTNEVSEEETILQKNCDWLLLRGFGASKLASVTVLMPFIGYAILYNAQVEEWLGGLGGLLDAQISGEACPAYFTFYERLNLFYCGLLSLGLSAIIFKIFAPKELKHYTGVDEFIDSVRPNLTARKIRSMYRTIKSRRPVIGASLNERAIWLENSVSISKASIEFTKNENEDLVLDLLRSFHQVQNRSNQRFAVLSCFLLFTVGTIILSLPAGAFSLRVLCVIFYG